MASATASCRVPNGDMWVLSESTYRQLSTLCLNCYAIPKKQKDTASALSPYGFVFTYKHLSG